MKIFVQIFCLGTIWSQISYSQEVIRIPMENPQQKGILFLNVNAGDINISGHNENLFIIEPVLDPVVDQVNAKSGTGIKRLENVSLDISITNSGNRVNLQSHNATEVKGFIIKVPMKCDVSVLLKTSVNIVVKGVSGDFDITNRVGGVDLSSVTGSVVVSAKNGPIKIDFQRLSEFKPSSITSMNFGIDLTLPASSNTGLRLKASTGSLNSDFDIDLKSEQFQYAEGNRISVERWMRGQLNSGGQTH